MKIGDLVRERESEWTKLNPWMKFDRAIGVVIGDGTRSHPDPPNVRILTPIGIRIISVANLEVINDAHAKDA